MRSRRWALPLLALATAFLALGALADAEVAQKGDIRVSFEGDLRPKALPRTASAPVPPSFPLPFEIVARRGDLGTVLTASLAGATGKAGYITELSLDLGKTTSSAATPYISAGCPAPKGFGGAVFPFAKATFEFAGA